MVAKDQNNDEMNARSFANVSKDMIDDYNDEDSIILPELEEEVEEIDIDLPDIEIPEAFLQKRKAGKNLSVEEVVHDDIEQKEKETVVVSKEESKEKKKNIPLLVGAITLAIGICVGIYFIDPFTQVQTKAPVTQTGAPQAPQSTDVFEDDVDTSEHWALKEGNYFPIKIDESRYSVFSVASDEDRKKVIDETYTQLGIFDQFYGLPSEATGATSDPALKEDEYGIPNPLYAPITQEEFSYSLGSMIEMIVNPVYGEWTELQFGEFENSTTSIAPHSTINVLEEKESPLFADWNKDNYGGQPLLTDGYRWIGDVTSLETSLSFDEALETYVGQSTIYVDYYAWGTSKETLKESKVLTIEFEIVESENVFEKILLNKASFSTEE